MIVGFSSIYPPAIGNEITRLRWKLYRRENRFLDPRSKCHHIVFSILFTVAEIRRIYYTIHRLSIPVYKLFQVIVKLLIENEVVLYRYDTE